MNNFNSQTIFISTLVLVSLLATGCGTSQPKPGLQATGISSATASPAATDSATSAVAASPAQASASPSQAYSGGSKAPEGEYRPADEFGPAQNVPKPVEPDGMNVESPEALFLFIDYWNELRNYAI